MSDEGQGRSLRQGRRVSVSAESARLVWLGPSDLMVRLPLRAMLESLSPDAPRAGGVECAELAALPRILAEPRPPDAVLSPLFWQDGDVMETARILSALDFGGAYRAVSPPLPRPGMVENEVRALCPDLDFALLALRRG